MTLSHVKNVLVTGGCGYIGSHVVRQLSEAGYKVTVVDNLSTGNRLSLLHGEPLIEGDLEDDLILEKVFKDNDYSAILHFAGSIVVPESVTNPIKYYENNTANTLRLLKKCLQNRVSHFIFSSTAAVYGSTGLEPLQENSILNPTNPYGRSKLMNEWILQDVANASSLKFMILRYFNVAGAEPLGRIGQKGKNSTHLIKVACEKLCGKRDSLQVFGNDYKTPDGTCIRDYIHVEDLAAAHLEALRHLEKGGDSQILNCGYGHGFSVKEVLAMMEEVTGQKLGAKIGPRRLGDGASLVADTEKIKKVLPQWQPKYQDLKKIIMSAYQWEKKI